jgi:arginyl-tRNA synthetase
VTTSEATENETAHPGFGNGAAYFNVIDIGQSYPQHYVKLGVMAVDHDERVERSAHLAYEKVVLTPATAERLGQPLSDEDRQRGSVAMSGRKGLGVKVDDMIDELEASAFSEVASRHLELSEEDKRETARKIAVGALRYFLLKYTRNSIISFDFKEALAMRGETGPYLQYTVARVNSVFRKLEESGINAAESKVERVQPGRIAELLAGPNGDGLWSLTYLAMRFTDIVRGAVASLEPALLAKWAFQLAQAFHSFYDDPDNRIITEADADRQALLAAITSIVRRQLLAALDVLGIEAPERM